MSGEMYKEHIVKYCNMVDTFNRTVWCELQYIYE